MKTLTFHIMLIAVLFLTPRLTLAEEAEQETSALAQMVERIKADAETFLAGMSEKTSEEGEVDGTQEAAEEVAEEIQEPADVLTDYREMLVELKKEYKEKLRELKEKRIARQQEVRGESGEDEAEEALEEDDEIFQEKRARLRKQHKGKRKGWEKKGKHRMEHGWPEKFEDWDDADLKDKDLETLVADRTKVKDMYAQMILKMEERKKRMKEKFEARLAKLDEEITKRLSEDAGLPDSITADSFTDVSEEGETPSMKDMFENWLESRKKK